MKAIKQCRRVSSREKYETFSIFQLEEIYNSISLVFWPRWELYSKQLQSRFLIVVYLNLTISSVTFLQNIYMNYQCTMLSCHSYYNKKKKNEEKGC